MKPAASRGEGVGVIRRREFVAAAPTVLLGASSLIACSQVPDPESYESVAALIRRPHVARRILGCRRDGRHRVGWRRVWRAY